MQYQIVVNNVKMVCSETLQKGLAGYRPTFSDFIDKLEQKSSIIFFDFGFF